MTIPKIKNLEFRKVTEDVLLVHQIKVPDQFSCCDGLLILPKEGRNSNSIILDLNIEPKYSIEIYKKLGPILHYVCTHGHMDHMSHVYGWEALNASIHAPFSEAYYLTDLYNFYNGFGFSEMMDFHTIEKFAHINKYFSCKEVNTFEPGDILKFENFEVETIPFKGHSKAHVGLYLPSEKILHISCLGFDQPEPEAERFGPWYGFEECSIELYLDDIDRAETIFLERAEFLTSSHAYIVKNPDKTPFEYMRRKIKENQKKISMAIVTSKLSLNLEESAKILLEQDLFFKKRKMKGFLKKIYTLWEYWIITKHLQRSYKSLEVYKASSA